MSKRRRGTERPGKTNTRDTGPVPEEVVPGSKSLWVLALIFVVLGYSLLHKAGAGGKAVGRWSPPLFY